MRYANVTKNCLFLNRICPVSVEKRYDLVTFSAPLYYENMLIIIYFVKIYTHSEENPAKVQERNYMVSETTIRRVLKTETSQAAYGKTHMQQIIYVG